MDVDNFLKKQSDVFQKVSESIREWTIGHHVASLIEKEGEISADALLKSLQLQIDASSSTYDKGIPDHDIVRMQAQAALSYLKGLLNSRAD
jgi:hypothetical protein